MQPCTKQGDARGHVTFEAILWYRRTPGRRTESVFCRWTGTGPCASTTGLYRGQPAGRNVGYDSAHVPGVVRQTPRNRVLAKAPGYSPGSPETSHRAPRASDGVSEDGPRSEYGGCSNPLHAACSLVDGRQCGRPKSGVPGHVGGVSELNTRRRTNSVCMAPGGEYPTDTSVAVTDARGCDVPQPAPGGPVDILQRGNTQRTGCGNSVNTASIGCMCIARGRARG